MTEDDFWDVSWTVRDIPPSHTDCTFSSFDWAREPGLKDEVHSFLKQIEKGESPNLFLTGNPGNGKTHISVAAFRWAVLRFGPGRCTFQNVPSFCDRVKKSFNEDEENDPWRRLESVGKLAVLDDIFGRDLSHYEAGTILSRLIDTVYTNSASVIFTSNFTREELGENLRKHELSRLMENVSMYEMTAKDHRP